MELKKLKYFVGVAEAGGFTKAAEQLNIAQSALSLHVRQLEEGFGTQLLVRDRTGVTMTAAGTKLLHHAKIILNQVRIVEEELTSKTKSPSGEVSIAIPSGPARFMVPELLSVAAERFPKISLRIVEGMSGPIEEWMLAGRFNLAILYKTLEDSAGYDIMAHEEFCLVIPPDKPPFENTVPLSELHAYPLAVPTKANNVRRSVADVVAMHGGSLNVRYELDSLSTIVGMVTDGKAYSILTPSAVQREASLGEIRIARIVEPSISRTIVLAVNPRDQRSVEVAAIRALVPHITRELIKDGKWPARAHERS